MEYSGSKGFETLTPLLHNIYIYCASNFIQSAWPGQVILEVLQDMLNVPLVFFVRPEGGDIQICVDQVSKLVMWEANGFLPMCFINEDAKHFNVVSTPESFKNAPLPDCFKKLPEGIPLFVFYTFLKSLVLFVSCVCFKLYGQSVSFFICEDAQREAKFKHFRNQ
jgi:hypothetical protein